VNWWLDGYVMAGKREDMANGIKAAVHLYYDDNTDATELEDGFLAALRQLVDFPFTSLVDDLDELIREAEKEINDAGGVMSATTNERHPVKTPSAWEDQ